jgi:hypothetical protein
VWPHQYVGTLCRVVVLLTGNADNGWEMNRLAIRPVPISAIDLLSNTAVWTIGAITWVAAWVSEAHPDHGPDSRTSTYGIPATGLGLNGDPALPGQWARQVDGPRPANVASITRWG